MGYLGYTLPNQVFQGVRTASFNGTGSQTVFTLPAPASSAAAIEIVVNNVQQSPYDGSYSVSGSTLTFSEAPSSGTNNVYVIYRDQTFMSTVPADGSVTPAKLSTGRPYWDSNGNVGINTSSPQGALEAVGVSYFTRGSKSLVINPNYSVADSHSQIQTASGMALAFATNGDTERMRIDSNGRVTTPYQPYIFGTPHNGTEGSSGTANKMNVFGTPVGLSFSNNRITVPIAGVYLLTWQTIAADTTSGRYDTAIYINGVERNSGLNEVNGNGYHMRTHTLSIYLAANDYIQYVHARWYGDGVSFSNWNTASVVLLG
jgi:hypothetical protein